MQGIYEENGLPVIKYLIIIGNILNLQCSKLLAVLIV